MIQTYFSRGNEQKRLVNDIRVLKSLEKAGHITLHAQTGKTVTWYGESTKAWYIDGYESRQFTHRGRKFVIEYRSGSFNPYVYALRTEEEIKSYNILNKR